MVKTDRLLLPCLLLCVAACNRSRGDQNQIQKLHLEKLRNATQGGQHLEVAEMAREAAELREYLERRHTNTQHPFDEPDGAQAFFLLKRIADGQNAYDPVRISQAIAQSEGM